MISHNLLEYILKLDILQILFVDIRSQFFYIIHLYSFDQIINDLYLFSVNPGL